ncbi:MAG: ABC transporter ATP-binding protein [Acidobacteria bacterium]|nr:ABC transporter ATP-binding protein [Acidobacteriota bacterium]
MDNTALLFAAGVAAIGLLLSSNVINLMSEVARVRYGHEFGHWLRLRLLRHLASQPYSFFLANNSSLLLKKVAGNVISYVQGVLLPLLDSIARLLSILLLLVVVCWVDPLIAAVAGGSLGGFYLIAFRYVNRRLTTTSDGLKEAERWSWHEAGQLLGGIKPVKVQRAEEFFINRFAQHSLDQARLMIWLPVYSNGPRYLIEPLAFGGLVAAVLFMAAQGRSLTAILPTLGVIALAGYRLIPTLQLLYGQIAQLRAMTHNLDEIYDEFASVDPDASTPSFPTADPLQWKHSLRLEHVAFGYHDGARPVIEDATLTIAKNSSVAFVGRSGCGKSTLLDIILGLHKPTAGAIFVDGEPLTPALIPAWLAAIGYVPQDIFLIDDTIAANIALGVPKDQIDYAWLEQVCAMAQLHGFVTAELPDGLFTIVGERGTRLSGGQRQRIGLARALYGKPQILVLDEATSALDHATETSLLEALAALRGSLTMLVVTHRLSSIQNYDCVYTISGGHIVPGQQAVEALDQPIAGGLAQVGAD